MSGLQSKLSNYLKDIYVFNEAVVKQIVRALGANYSVTSEASKQGGGGEQVDFHWPNGFRIDTKYLVALDHTLYTFGEWGLDTSVVGPNKHLGREHYYLCKVRQQGLPIASFFSATARNPTAGLWLALLHSGFRPYANKGHIVEQPKKKLRLRAVNYNTVLEANTKVVTTHEYAIRPYASTDNVDILPCGTIGVVDRTSQGAIWIRVDKTLLLVHYTCIALLLEDPPCKPDGTSPSAPSLLGESSYACATPSPVAHVMAAGRS